jgi:hypothetical protein
MSEPSHSVRKGGKVRATHSSVLTKAQPDIARLEIGDERLPCGCTLTVGIAGTAFLYFCPLHRNAERLLAACERGTELAQAVRDAAWPLGTQQWARAVKLACAFLAAAEPPKKSL